MKSQHLLSNISPCNGAEELFEVLAQSPHIKIERIVSYGEISPKEGWYDQTSSEWVMVVSGKAILAFEDGEKITLAPNDYCLIPPHARHKVTYTENPTVWLAIHFE